MLWIFLKLQLRGNKSRFICQEMCRHMYVPLPGVSFQCCEGARRRSKPFSTPGLFFPPHKITQGCSNICPYNSSVTLYFPGFVSDSLSLLLFPLRHPSVRAPTSQRVLSPTQVSAKLVMFLAFIL